jgi:hypothetical protein
MSRDRLNGSIIARTPFFYGDKATGRTLNSMGTYSSIEWAVELFVSYPGHGSKSRIEPSLSSSLH